LRKLSLHTRVKIAVLISAGALFAPIAAQAGSPDTKTATGTVSFELSSCTNDANFTSVAARSAVLIIDTLTAVANSDAAYAYFTETDTAAFGAVYDYGKSFDATACQYAQMTGTVTLTRGRFMSSSAAHSETTTNTTDFIQYVGNTKVAGVNSGNYQGLACGNLTVPRAASITASCSPTILSDYKTLAQNNSVLWRDGSTTSSANGNQSADAYILVKVRKTAIAGATAGASFVATETFTVTSN
jgi:hypothetical protein